MFVEFMKDKKIIWRGNIDQIPRVNDIVTFDRSGTQYTVHNLQWVILEDANPEVTIYI